MERKISKKEITIDEMAKMVMKGLESTTTELRKEIKNESSGLKKEINDRMNSISTEIESIRRGQNRIEDRLDQMTVDKKTLKNHGERIIILEKKVFFAR